MQILSFILMWVFWIGCPHIRKFTHLTLMQPISQCTSSALLEWVDHVLSSSSTSIPGSTPLATHESKESTAEDVGEDIVHSWATTSSFPQALFPIAIIKFLLFRVGQHLIGKADFFKLCREKDSKQQQTWNSLCCSKINSVLTETSTKALACLQKLKQTENNFSWS